MQGAAKELHTVRCNGRRDFRERSKDDVLTAGQAAGIEVGVSCFSHATICEPDSSGGNFALCAP
eukprot:15315302-Ditylum_brightwellii.AAC.1